MGLRRQDPKQRFVSYVRIGRNNCWNWQNHLDPNGYGRFVLDDKNRAAHRVSYEFFVGPIPNGLHIDHLCDNRGCVNPTHLKPATPKENLRRARAKITHCPQGHPYSEENTFLNRGRRQCRECRRGRGNQEPKRSLVPHGTPSRYTYGCRCSECKESIRVRTAEYRARKKAVT